MRHADHHAHREKLREIYRISDAWRDLGFEGKAAVSCRCPWREDKKPSFSIFDNDSKFKDHSTNDSGDVFSFVMLALGFPFKEAIRWIENRAGVENETATPLPMIIRRPSSAQTNQQRKTLKLPALDVGNTDNIEQVARSRFLNPEVVELVVKLGTLRFGEVCSCRSWVLLDDSGKLAEARRIDGKPFDAVGNLPARKAHTLAGSSKSWPLGLIVQGSPPAKDATILMVEGGPDYLASFWFLLMSKTQGFHPVAMLGKSNRIPTDALNLMAGRKVRIFPHHDPGGGGMEAAQEWYHQLAEVGCSIDGFSFEGLTRRDGKAVTDLNDLILADEAGKQAWKGVLS